MKGMKNDVLRDRVARAIVEHFPAPSHPDNDDFAEATEYGDAALAALGLDDFEAAVDRGGHAFADHCEDRYDFRPALSQRDIVSEIVLRAALTPPGEQSG